MRTDNSDTPAAAAAAAAAAEGPILAAQLGGWHLGTDIADKQAAH
jgi:hypothetical protein